MSHSTLLLAVIASLSLAGCASVSAPGSAPERADSTDEVRILERRDPPPEDEDLMFQLLKAEFAGARGLVTVALDAYMRAMMLTDEPEVATRATRVAMFANQDIRGLEAAGRWVELAPDDHNARQTLAIAYLRVGDRENSLKEFRELVFRADDPSAALLQITSALGREEDRDRSLDLLGRLVDSFDDLPVAHFVYGQSALQSGYPERAVSAAEAGLGRDPDSRELATLRAQALIEAGREEDGIEAVKELAIRYPEDGELRIYLARQLLEAGRAAEALEHFRRALEDRPDDTGLLYATGLLSMEAGQLERARHYLTRLLEIGGREDEVYFFLGQIAEDLEEHAEAIDWYTRVRGDNREPATFRRALLLGEVDRVDEARELLVGMRRDNPDETVRSYLIEGEILRRARQLDTAMELYGEALAEEPGNLDLMYGRALVAVLKDDVGSAERDLRYILDREPDNAMALNALGYTLVDATDRHEEGMELVRRAYALEPDNAAVLDSMGWGHYRLGNHEQALEYLRRAYEMMPDAEIGAHLGEVLWKTNERDEARRIWEEARELDPDHPVLKETLERLDP